MRREREQDEARFEERHTRMVSFLNSSIFWTIELTGCVRNETLAFPAGPTTPKLQVKVYEHKTLGKDKQIGEADVDVRGE